MASKRKDCYSRTEGSSHESTRQWLIKQRCHAKFKVWKIANFLNQDFAAKFTSVMYILLKFYLTYSNLYISAGNKHIHINTLCNQLTMFTCDVRFSNGAPWHEETPVRYGHVAGPNGVPLSHFSLYLLFKRQTSFLYELKRKYMQLVDRTQSIH